MTTPDFIKRMDWEMLRQQKQFLIDLNHHHADGIVHLIDAMQDYAVDELGIDENVVFNFPTRKFRLLSNPGGMWREGSEGEDGPPMKVGRIIYDNEILNGEPFSYWYVDQEEYFEELDV